MRLSRWQATTGCLAWIWAAVAWGQLAWPPPGVVLQKPAHLATDPPIAVLQEYARNYQALKRGQPPETMGISFLLAQSTLQDCSAFQSMAAFTEFSTSFQRMAGRRDPTWASNREIVLTSIARYACGDSEGSEATAGVASVPAYGMMSHMKGTFAETIAPRERTILPGMAGDQAAAFQRFGDATQRFRTDPAPVPGAGTIAGRMAALQEVMKLPPEERKKAVDELNARYAKEKVDPAAQAGYNDTAQHMIEALSAKGEGAPDPLAFLQRLQPGEAYVDFYKYYVREGDGFGALHYLAVISESRGSHLVRLGPADPIDRAIDEYSANSADRKDFVSGWKDLQRLVVEPLLASLPNGTKMIWASPDSNLFGLPLASLVLDSHSDLSVTIVPSAYDFSRLASGPVGLPPSGKVLLVGDLADAHPDAPALQAVALADVSSEFAGQGLQVRKLSGRDATLPNVLGGMKDAQYMLFSTHGRWENPTGTPISEVFGSAGIELWPEGSDSQSSVLTAADIVKSDLSQSDLVVLLACETAKGQAVSGQGLLGFQSAFMVAGARSLLVALWRVPAEPSKQLVQNFYTGLFKLHLSKTEALKHAQTVLRSQPRFADPWNWAGWVLVGDPRSVAH